jgi:hypothetical protein
MNYKVASAGHICDNSSGKYPIVDQIQVLNSEYLNHPWMPGWSTVVGNITYLENWQDARKDIPVVCGSDVGQEHVRTWLNEQRPALYVGRGYCGNHTTKKRNLWRVSVNGWANTVLNPFPHSRWGKMNLTRHAWKVQKINRVLIAPSKMASNVWTGQITTDWANSMLDKFPGAEVKIRYKADTPGLRWQTLWEDLDWADLVVTQSSAITCEALWYGKKVLSLEPCPTWAAGRTTLENWDDPGGPEFRDAWHEHLAWSQFTVDEWASGEALQLIEKYVGPIVSYQPGHTYNLKERASSSSMVS